MQTISRITQDENKNYKNLSLFNKVSSIWLILGIVILLTLQGCGLFGSDREPTIEGCTTSGAINFNPKANLDNGSCRYSTASFYAKFSFFAGIPITSIDVAINNGHEGTITAVYPNGPGNCSASGTVQYVFKSDETIDWNTTVYLANGGTVLNSGRLSPSRTQDCIRVNVTR